MCVLAEQPQQKSQQQQQQVIKFRKVKLRHGKERILHRFYGGSLQKIPEEFPQNWPTC